MKILRNIIVLFVLTSAFYSCDADVTIADDTKKETVKEDVNAKTGEEGNETEGRDEG